MEYTYLRHVLDWAGKIPFYQADRIEPTLPEYLLSARRDGEHQQLSAEIIKKTLAATRGMFYWLSEYQRYYKTNLDMDISIGEQSMLKIGRITKL